MSGRGTGHIFMHMKTAVKQIDSTMPPRSKSGVGFLLWIHLNLARKRKTSRAKHGKNGAQAKSSENMQTKRKPQFCCGKVPESQQWNPPESVRLSESGQVSERMMGIAKAPSSNLITDSFAVKMHHKVMVRTAGDSSTSQANALLASSA